MSSESRWPHQPRLSCTVVHVADDASEAEYPNLLEVGVHSKRCVFENASSIPCSAS